jgi:hypothetical protein
MAICDMWSGAESLTNEKKTNPKLMRTIYDNNSPDNLRREVSRLDSGIYVVQGLGSSALLAAARVTIKRGRAAPQYGDSQAGRPMYMEIFGASADAEEAWPGYLQSMVDQARKDFGRSMGSRVTKLCAYASPGANERFPDAVRSINPRTYEKHGGEEGSFGVVGGVSGLYFRHDVEFEIPQTSCIREALSNATYPLLGVPSKSPLDELVPARTGSTEEVPVAA